MINNSNEWKILVHLMAICFFFKFAPFLYCVELAELQRVALSTFYSICNRSSTKRIGNNWVHSYIGKQLFSSTDIPKYLLCDRYTNFNFFFHRILLIFQQLFNDEINIFKHWNINMQCIKFQTFVHVLEIINSVFEILLSDLKFTLLSSIVSVK